MYRDEKQQLVSAPARLSSPGSPVAGGPLQLVPHPQSIGHGGLVQGQEQDLSPGRQLRHQAEQGGLGAPQTLQEPGVVGEGVDHQAPPHRSGLVGELSGQGRDPERGGEVSRLGRGGDPRTGVFPGPQRHRVVSGVREMMLSLGQAHPLPRCPRMSSGHMSCHNKEEAQQSGA